MKKPNKQEPLVSIVTINFNDNDVTCQLLDSLSRSTYSNMEIIVVDNGSTKCDPSEIKEKHPKVNLIISETNLGFAGGNNLGINNSSGELIFLLNNDTEITPATIEPLVNRLLEDETLGAVSPKIKYFSPPNLIQYAGSTAIHPLTLRNGHVGNLKQDDGRYDTEQDTHYAHGAAMMIPTRVIKRVGQMAEMYFLYYEELDWCERIKKAGFRIRYVPSSTIYHKESTSTGKDSVLKMYYITRNRLLFARRNITGWKFLVSAIYIALVSVPKNTLTNISDPKRLRAYYSGLIWNLSNGKLNLKPF